MTDFYHSPTPTPPPMFGRSFGSPYDVNSAQITYSHGKRRRHYDEENETENTSPHCSSFNDGEDGLGGSESMSSYYPAEKRARAKAFVTPTFHNDGRIHELEKGIQRFEEEIHYLKENLEGKNGQIDTIMNDNQELRQQCETFAENNSRMTEENRILKKAVGIQESRLRELQNQNQQMQELMNQAADYIAGLERTNAALRHRVEYTHSSNQSFLPDVPPDVY